MIDLRCTVRGCKESLSLQERSLRCPRGHSFDRAKEGYWNLTQPQDKKSSNPGDSDAAVLARQRWLSRGYGASLIEALRELAILKDESGLVVDLGCGEGSFGKALFADQAESFCGIDLSRKAIRLASRNWPEATWVLANADRGLPFAYNSIHVVMSLFGRRPIAEINRVLVEGGRCVVAVPGEEDLIELREKVQQTGRRRSRWETIVEEMSSVGFSLANHQKWFRQVELGPDEIADALAMTYRAVRNSEQSKLASIDRTRVTLAADILLLTRP